MNLARVEHYFAEVLSRVEDRRLSSKTGRYETPQVLGQALAETDLRWEEMGIPANLALVGTVNMDESTHGFSRKVLDRAFTLEFADIHLEEWQAARNNSQVEQLPRWPVEAWFSRAARLGELSDVTASEKEIIERVIQVLTEVNKILVGAQLQVGYRVRDEIALFMLHAADFADYFVTSQGETVEPLDISLQMKILPRIVGGNAAIRQTLLGLLGWAHTGSPLVEEEEAADVLRQWVKMGRTSRFVGSNYPCFTARLCLMWERLQTEGYTSYWW